MLGFTLLALLAAPNSAPAKTETARIKKILDASDDLFRGTSAHGKMMMTVRTEHWTRSLALNFWSQGEDKSFIIITSPKKEKGIKTLRLAKDMWNFLPKVKRIIKIPSSMMGGSWMGSHLSNNDLVKQSRMDEDFDANISFEGLRNGKSIIEITGIAREEAVVVWGKVVLVCDAKSLLPLRIEHYDEDMALSRTTSYGEQKTFGKRTIPSLIRIVPADKPKEYTEVRYADIQFDTDIPAHVFTTRNLKR